MRGVGTDLGNHPKGNMALAVVTDINAEPMHFDTLCRAPGFDTGDTLDAAARWMWFDDDRTDALSAFQA